MASQDAKFNGQIFRKDNPLILAMRRDLASFVGVRVVYDSSGYMPGQVIVRKPSDGLFYKYSAASGGSFDSAMVLFDQATNDDQIAAGDGLSGVSGATLLRGLAAAYVYTANLIDYSAGAKTALGAKDMVDSGGVAITKF